jgi:hypothetical protein
LRLAVTNWVTNGTVQRWIIVTGPVPRVLKIASSQMDWVRIGQAAFAILQHCDNCLKRLNLLFPHSDQYPSAKPHHIDDRQSG